MYRILQGGGETIPEVPEPIRNLSTGDIFEGYCFAINCINMDFGLTIQDRILNIDHLYIAIAPTTIAYRQFNGIIPIPLICVTWVLES